MRITGNNIFIIRKGVLIGLAGGTLNYVLILSWFFMLLGCNRFDNTKKSVKETQEQYNILWLTCEDMSPDLPMYGDSTIQTPNLSRLASEGIVFKNAFSTAGVCSPSRSAIITGMYQNSIGTMHHRVTSADRVGLQNYEAVLPEKVRPFTEYLRNSGYYCTNRSKTDYQFETPVTVWDDNNDYAHWRKRPDPDQPFFSIFNFRETHESNTWEKAHLEHNIDLNNVKVPPYFPNTDVTRETMATYYNNIRVMDKRIGMILNSLEEDGLLDKTIIFFFSDHGEGLPRGKRWLYDSGMKVPFIIRYPDGKRAGTFSDRLISFVDLAPTMLSLAGIKPPGYLQGKAFAGKYEKEERQYVFAAKDRMDNYNDMIRAVRNEKYKLLKNFMPDKPYIQPMEYRDQNPIMGEIYKAIENDQLTKEQKPWTRKVRPEYEFYVLDSDPFEVNNQINNERYSKVIKKMKRQLNDWMREIDDMGSIPEGELRNMFWPDGKQPVTKAPTYKIKSGKLKLDCSTEGASIAYRFQHTSPWKVYFDPVEIEDRRNLEILAHREGYKPSEIIEVKIAE